MMSGCSTVGRMVVTTRSPPRKSSLYAPLSKLVYIWATTPFFSAICSRAADDSAKQAMLWQLEVGAGVGLEKARLSARPKLSRSAIRLCHRGTATSILANRFVRGFVADTGPADPASRPYPSRSRSKRLMVSGATGSAVPFVADCPTYGPTVGKVIL